MRLSHKTICKVDEQYSNIIGHMCYAAYKLWNVCNYERMHYQELDLPVPYPNWYYQKSAHKDDLWFKSLPAQTAQEVCKQLDKSWKSFYALNKSKGIENPRPPRFKQENMAIVYMQMGIVHHPETETVRLSIPKNLKEYMQKQYGICENYLYLENRIFKDMDVIKQIKLYPPENGRMEIIVVYEVPDVEPVPDNGHYLSIDLGLHNLMTCYDSSGKAMIVGRKYLSICRTFDKTISSVQSAWSSSQVHAGVKYPKSSKHIRRLYKKKANAVNDYLHKVTRYVVEYCKENGISKVIIGDITHIRKGKDLGHVNNQKLHSLPFDKIYRMLSYKLAMYGIVFEKQTEAYTSQCSPLSSDVSKKSATKRQRVKRGLYRENGQIWNADAVGAYNIMRLYAQNAGVTLDIPCRGLSNPEVIKVAV